MAKVVNERQEPLHNLPQDLQQNGPINLRKETSVDSNRGDSQCS